jgi:heme oxygenase (mycobilin-producing)
MVMAQAILINAFEVPDGHDDEFLEGWEEGKRLMERRPGYVSTALHRSLDPTARFRYINIAVWESAEAFQAALTSPEFTAYRARIRFAHYPSVYEVVRA